ncbi:MAG: hypothetical protein M1825_001593 [Sarcosagium campestre]|nr:MAG: hypothetical protein M1825_001593 [Sarcosagium campestre]
MHFPSAVIALVTLASVSVATDKQCGPSYEPCDPQEAKTDSAPSVGGDSASLYVNILESIKGIHWKSKAKRSPLPRIRKLLGIRAPSAPICCAATTQCLLVKNANIPFCYDKFTTNFFLPDGSYGNVVSGDYTAEDGATANLISGDFTLKDGQKGNVYAGKEKEKPNMATLTLPEVFTAAGVGEAIAASNLGGLRTYTTTVPTTITGPTTLAPETLPSSIESGRPVPGLVLPGATVDGTTTTVRTSVGVTSVPTSDSATASATGAGASPTNNAPANVGVRQREDVQIVQNIHSPCRLVADVLIKVDIMRRLMPRRFAMSMNQRGPPGSIM